MVAATSRFPHEVKAPSDEPRILLHDVPWSTYVVLRDSIDSPGVRMTYLGGALEIMTPSRGHEVDKTQIARLLELFCLERDIPLFAYGSTTFRKEEQERGLEPDECYCRDADRELPDLALEVIATHGLLDKLDVYRGLGIREVWMFEAGAFTVVTLRAEGYVQIAASEIFPEIDLARIAHFAGQPDQHAALRAFRGELRGA